MAIPDMLKFMWEDQAELNKLFRADGPPTDRNERITLTKEMMLHLIHECGSVLDSIGTWKSHRYVRSPENRAATGIELVDIGKYWMTLCQIHGFTAQEMFELSNRKSMVVRQRHAEEWVKDITRPSVVIDLDMVLCNYLAAFVSFMEDQRLIPRKTAISLIEHNQWVDAASVGLTDAQFNDVKHRFRAEGGFAALEPMPGARSFMDWCEERGWQVIILTSRPIEAYPNVYSDTLIWLDKYHIRYDRIWWARDKADLCIERDMRTQIVFAVDDERRHVESFVQAGIRTFWMNPQATDLPILLEGQSTSPVRVIKDLREIVTIWESEHEHVG